MRDSEVPKKLGKYKLSKGSTCEKKNSIGVKRTRGTQGGDQKRLYRSSCRSVRSRKTGTYGSPVPLTVIGS